MSVVWFPRNPALNPVVESRALLGDDYYICRFLVIHFYCFIILVVQVSIICDYKGLFGLRGEGGGVEESRIKLAKNRLILGKFYFTLLSLPSPQSKRTIVINLKPKASK